MYMYTHLKQPRFILTKKNRHFPNKHLMVSRRNMRESKKNMGLRLKIQTSTKTEQICQKKIIMGNDCQQTWGFINRY